MSEGSVRDFHVFSQILVAGPARSSRLPADARKAPASAHTREGSQVEGRFTQLNTKE
jgi:hypothetical protein